MADKRGWWQLVVVPDGVELSDVDIEHIADSIRDGMTQGEIVADDPAVPEGTQQ